MQNDLISRKPLIDMLQGVEDNIFAEATRDFNPAKAFIAGVLQEVKNQVIALPGVDAVPVVRCRECWRHQTVNCPMFLRGGDYACHDGFCHMGAKKDEPSP